MKDVFKKRRKYMYYGQRENKKSSNNEIILYQQPLPERILVLSSSALFTLMFVVLYVYTADSSCFYFIVGCVVFDVIIYFDSMKTYLSFDTDKNVFIAKSFGKTREEIPIRDIERIKITYDNAMLCINVILKNGHVINNIGGWEHYTIYKAALVDAYDRQYERLDNFAEKCNEYIESRDKQYWQ